MPIGVRKEVRGSETKMRSPASGPESGAELIDYIGNKWSG